VSNNHNYAHISGILSIVTGSIGILIGLSLVGFGIVFYYMFSAAGMDGFYTDPLLKEFFPWIFIGIFGLIGLGICVIGALSVIGGNFALKRERWTWALAGAIAGSLVFFFTGIAAVVLVSLSKSEFEAKAAVAAQEITQEVVPPPAVF
jgi:hypothetical protein